MAAVDTVQNKPEVRVHVKCALCSDTNYVRLRQVGSQEAAWLVHCGPFSNVYTIPTASERQLPSCCLSGGAVLNLCTAHSITCQVLRSSTPCTCMG
jgi:hypothetical protein